MEANSPKTYQTYAKFMGLTQNIPDLLKTYQTHPQPTKLKYLIQILRNLLKTYQTCSKFNGLTQNLQTMIHLSILPNLIHTSIHMSKRKLKIKKPIKRPTCFSFSNQLQNTINSKKNWKKQLLISIPTLLGVTMLCVKTVTQIF